jgi:antitoxin (DNA-binding transcriptional repressor) of toxin-antitoxin stability system
MAIVKMRELLRNPKSVFEELERSGEPVLLTRDGQAVAALFPVDPERAEQIAMAALPEFVQSRARARNARSEERTASAAELLGDFESRHGTGGGEPPATPVDAPMAIADNSSDSEAEVETALVEDMEILFGETLSRELAGEVEERIAAASEPVLEAAPSEVREQNAAGAHFARRVRELNGELFGRLLLDTLECTTLSRFASAPFEPGRRARKEAGGVFGRPLAVETLDAVEARVRSFNCDLLANRSAGQTLSLPIYEACVRGAQAMESADILERPAHVRRHRD